MATAQLHRTQGKTWEAIFPNEQVTEQKSALFVKKLLAVAISNITYLRAIFPEHAYGDKSLEDLNLKILRDESSCPGACQVIKWVKGCFDALDKKYLKTLIIGIYVDPNNPESVIESYTFKFSYNKEGEVDIYRNDKKLASAYSSEETKKSTIRLLRTLIILTNTLTSLPDNVMMTMKLFYYDEVTPADYEPPGFRPADDYAFEFAEEATNIAVGEVATPFHVVKMRIKTGKKQFEIHDEPVEEMEHSEQSMSISNAGLDNENNAVQEIQAEKTNNFSDHNKEAKDNVASKKKLSPEKPDPHKSPDKPETEEEDFLVRCPCGCNEDDGLMVMCSKCKFWQHAICFLIKSEDKAPVDHICDLCARPNDPKIVPTDPYLCNLSTVEKQGTCLWRRTLYACLEYKRILAPQLARRLGVDNNVAQGLINRMEKEKFLTVSNSGKRLGKIVEVEKIRNDGIPRYLSTPSAVLQTSLDQSVTKDNSMNIKTVKDASADKDISTLSLKTSKLNLQNPKRVTRSCNSEIGDKPFPTQETKVKKGRKRAYSKINSNEFDISNSQENLPAVTKKKASIVAKDIAV